MNKDERKKFILNNSNGQSEDLINRCLKLLKCETEGWDYDLLKKVLFNKTHSDKIVVLSVNSYEELYNSQNNTDFLINYYSFTNKMFCFACRKSENFDLYKSFIRDKKLQNLLNE